MGFFEKVKNGLSRTRSSLGSVFSGFPAIDGDFYDELEERLILADVGVEAAEQAVERLRARVREDRLRETEAAREALRDILAEMLAAAGETALRVNTSPSVVLAVGVNGAGKTTTIGKLAGLLREDGKKVLLCAADTFRAAAADQLEVWARRSRAELVRQNEGADPASVVYDAISAARARGTDVILCDTAGRLHNKRNLMNELGKISRVVDRELPGTDKEVLLVLDATTGQNGLVQAKEFQQIAGVTGIVLTKLDGTAKGGIVVAVARTLGIPVKYIGVGEQMDDLMPFEPRAFADALL